MPQNAGFTRTQPGFASGIGIESTRISFAAWNRTAFMEDIVRYGPQLEIWMLEIDGFILTVEMEFVASKHFGVVHNPATGKSYTSVQRMI